MQVNTFENGVVSNWLPWHSNFISAHVVPVLATTKPGMDWCRWLHLVTTISGRSSRVSGDHVHECSWLMGEMGHSAPDYLFFRHFLRDKNIHIFICLENSHLQLHAKTIEFIEKTL